MSVLNHYKDQVLYESALRQTVNEDGENVRHKGDCVIKAIVFCTGLPYFQVWEALQVGVKHGGHRKFKKKNSGGYFSKEYEIALRELGISFKNIMCYSKFSYTQRAPGSPKGFVRRSTITQNIKRVGKGIYLHKSRSHLIGIKDGKPNHIAARYQTLEMWELDLTNMVEPKGKKKEAPKPAPAAPDRPSVVNSKEVIPYTRVWGLLQDATRAAGYSRCRKTILKEGKEVSFDLGTRGVSKGDTVVVACRTKDEKATIHITIS